MNKTSNYYFPLNDKNLLCHTVKSSGQVGDRTHNGPLRGLWCYPQHHFFAKSARITPHGVHLYRNSPAFPTGVFIFEMSIHPSHSLCHIHSPISLLIVGPLGPRQIIARKTPFRTFVTWTKFLDNS